MMHEEVFLWPELWNFQSSKIIWENEAWWYLSITPAIMCVQSIFCILIRISPIFPGRYVNLAAHSRNNLKIYFF